MYSNHIVHGKGYVYRREYNVKLYRCLNLYIYMYVLYCAAAAQTDRKRARGSRGRFRSVRSPTVSVLVAAFTKSRRPTVVSEREWQTCRASRPRTITTTSLYFRAPSQTLSDISYHTPFASCVLFFEKKINKKNCFSHFQLLRRRTHYFRPVSFFFSVAIAVVPNVSRWRTTAISVVVVCTKPPANTTGTWSPVISVVDIRYSTKVIINNLFLSTFYINVLTLFFIFFLLYNNCTTNIL